MSTAKHIEKICAIITVIAVVFTVLFMNGQVFGIVADDSVSYGYEETLFDDSYVHTINIEMEDWDSFIENATSEEYSPANITIDGETVKNVGIRGKGNTSLSTVAQLNSQRYSLKVEFDAYQASGNYHGLDKLCLNNLIQDYTMMKDYIAYKLMGEFGVSAPLVSFCFITVNREDWGLYLAAEAVEDSFLRRNYGTSYGNLYKPDSMDMGGGRGNGGGFDMKDMDFDAIGMKNPFESGSTESGAAIEGGFPTPPGGDSEGGFSGPPSGDSEGGFSGPPGGGFGGSGMGSDDAKLKYIDDDPDSYSTIFDSAKTSIDEADKQRLISALKSLGEGIENADEDSIADAVDTDAVLRYMVVHNFLVNGDSYTGSMIHNYYLYEEDGQLSMLPWDYNLAFGTFQASEAEEAVNDPIDTPLSVTEDSTDRPMFSWITATEGYKETYHTYYQEFLEQFYTSGYLADLIRQTSEMLQEYVEKDPTKFCTTEEYEKAVETMQAFTALRCESIAGQLDGTTPSTDAGQEAEGASLISADGLTLSDMGSMGGGMGGGPGGGEDRHSRRSSSDGEEAAENKPEKSAEQSTEQSTEHSTESSTEQGSFTPPQGGPPSGDFPGGSFPGGDFSGGGSASTLTMENIMPLLYSGLALCGAIVFALLFRRVKRTKN